MSSAVGASALLSWLAVAGVMLASFIPQTANLAGSETLSVRADYEGPLSAADEDALRKRILPAAPNTTIDVAGTRASITMTQVHGQKAIDFLRESGTPAGILGIHEYDASCRRSPCADTALLPPSITNVHIQGANPAPAGRYGYLQLGIRLTNEGSQRLEALTRRSIDRPIAIVIDGVVHSAPTVMEPITGGTVQITFGAPQDGKTMDDQRAEMLWLADRLTRPPLEVRRVGFEVLKTGI